MEWILFGIGSAIAVGWRLAVPAKPRRRPAWYEAAKADLKETYFPTREQLRRDAAEQAAVKKAFQDGCRVDGVITPDRLEQATKGKNWSQ